jgi:hypothetical protein
MPLDQQGQAIAIDHEVLLAAQAGLLWRFR